MSNDPINKTDRSPRVRIDRTGTVRDRTRYAVDVTIKDLSETGCYVSGQFAVEVGVLISVGIPGIGMHAARVSRIDEDGCGCAFLLPIDSDHIGQARAAETLTEGGFIQMKTALRSAATVEHNRRADDGAQPLLARMKRAVRIVRGKPSGK